jgi:hypothetical protein
MARRDNFYSDQCAPWLHENYPVLGRYARATTPFRALTHIANCPKPLNKRDGVWLEDLSEKYHVEWEQVLTQVRRQGSPSLKPAPLLWLVVVLKVGLGWSLCVQVQQIAWGWLAMRQLRRLSLRHVQQPPGKNRDNPQRIESVTVGTLKDGYVCNVPLPRVPRIQSAKLIAPSRCSQTGIPLPDYSPVTGWIPTLPKLGSILGFSQRIL